MEKIDILKGLLLEINTEINIIHEGYTDTDKINRLKGIFSGEVILSPKVMIKVQKLIREK